ncbi:MAG: major capsid protein [Leifsonia sp.]
MALTLLEANKLNDGNVKRAAVIEMFAYNSDLLRVLPFEDIPGGSLSYSKEGSLPGVGFRGFNQSYTSTEGILNPETEVLRIIGGQLDVDKAMIRTRGPDIRSTQETAHIKAITLSITAAMINGDSEADVRQFDGLRKRINGSQLIPANLAAPNANSPLSLEALNTAIDKVDSPTHLLMSKAMRTKLTTAARSTTVGGFIETTIDEFGRQVTVYNGLPILIADYDNNGQYILQFNEAGPGGGTTSESIYVLSIGDGKVTGLQNGTMEVEDLGAVQDAPVMRTRLEWIVGFAVMHGRGASRLWGITNAPITA